MMSFIDLFLQSILCGVGVACMSGPLGCFLVWRRMAYFGDTLAHSSLLGVALALFLHTDISITVMCVCLLLAGILVFFEHKTQLANDTVLGILANSCLAAGMVLVSFVKGVRLDLMSFLFGDILAVSDQDVRLVFITLVFVLSVCVIFWRKLLAMTVDQDVAAIEGQPVLGLRLLLTWMIALVIAVSMKIVGILLITSLLIIPAASARQVAKSPAQMAIGAAVLGIVAVLIGMTCSYLYDLPSGPAIVLAEGAVFFAMGLISKR